MANFSKSRVLDIVPEDRQILKIYEFAYNTGYDGSNSKETSMPKSSSTSSDLSKELRVVTERHKHGQKASTILV